MKKKIVVYLLCMLLILIAILPVSEAINKQKNNVNYQTMDESFEVPTMVEIYGSMNEKSSISKQKNIICNNPADIDIDFSFLDYGIAVLDIWKVIAGDYNMDTGLYPTIRNIGTGPVYIKIIQDDMNFGQTAGEWNVEYGVQIGQENVVYFEPYETIQLPKVLNPGEMEKLDFHIRVKKGFPGTTYEGLLEIWAEDAPPNNPPTAPFVDGIFNGNANTQYGYYFTSTDPEQDQISYYIEWGDNTITDWTPLIPSGDTYYEDHSWEPGTYILKAYAKDSNDDISERTDVIITMTKGKIASYYYLINFLRYYESTFPILEFNSGIFCRLLCQK